MEDRIFHEDDSLFQDLSFDFLQQDDALFSTRHFCTSVSTQGILLQDEPDAFFTGDILSIWDEMEQGTYLSHQKSDKDSDENAQKLEIGKAMELQRRRPSGHGSEAKPLTFELVSQYFCMPIKQAARELNVGLTLLKRRCRVLGIPRWPHRKMKSLDTLIRSVEEIGEQTGQLKDKARNAVEMLQQKKKLIEQKPDVELDDWTKTLRQMYFKKNYKRRVLAIEK
ncbi:protein RKD1-like [Oryza brachyantha]|uniref:RWP-RK domain-containing protein n=1 Tax=Oryza brachyantha TaxID=4533 RepID=J3LH14_ORYBR|nr:protein RKD1-like [Oryza brachyantha]